MGRYAAINEVAASQLIAAGDSYNDLPLLEACGLPIAMGNAAPELKIIANYVVLTVDEDGLAVAIDEFLFPLFERPTTASTNRRYFMSCKYSYSAVSAPFAVNFP